MSSRVYQPVRNPPTWWDRLLVHPLDTAVGVIAVVFGIIITLSVLVTGFVPSESMDRMPGLVILLVGVLLGLGGVLALVGLNWWGDAVSRGWGIERFGWLLVTGGFVTYAISVSWHYPASVFSWGVPAVLGAGCLLRFWSIIMVEKSVRLKLANVEADQHE